MSGKLVLVSGASGYIGCHVVRELLDNGYRVRGTVRSVKKKAEKLQDWVDAGEPLELVEADLTKPESWVAACAGCDLVAHVASPFFVGCPESEAEEKLYKPARDGTLSVLRAAKQAGTVTRVVVTSSVAAIQNGHPKSALAEEPEKLWTVMDTADPYSKSKTLAERAAWDFVKENDNCFELATINPCLVVGPPLTSASATSHDIVKRFVMREMPGVPDIFMSIVDVRDVAKAHRLALEKPEAAGERFACVGHEANFLEWSRLYATELKQYGYNPPTWKLPKPLLWLASFADSGAKAVLPQVGKPPAPFGNGKIKRVLGLEFHEEKATLIDHAHACIRLGTKGFKKTAKYAAAFPSDK